MDIAGSYNGWLVALSYGVACAGSYGSLRSAHRNRIFAGDRGSAPFAAITPAAVIMGFAIWATHFAGMAAFHQPGVTIGYRLDLTLLSLFVAVVFTWFGFATLMLGRHLPDAFVLAGIPMGCGILTMHFTGMVAMTGAMIQGYDASLVAGSAAIAICASIAALWFMARPYRPGRAVLAAMVMGVAICGMHYVGMAAAHFRMTPPPAPADSTGQMFNVSI